MNTQESVSSLVNTLSKLPLDVCRQIYFSGELEDLKCSIFRACQFFAAEKERILEKHCQDYNVNYASLRSKYNKLLAEEKYVLPWVDFMRCAVVAEV